MQVRFSLPLFFSVGCLCFGAVHLSGCKTSTLLIDGSVDQTQIIDANDKSAVDTLINIDPASAEVVTEGQGAFYTLEKGNASNSIQSALSITFEPNLREGSIIFSPKKAWDWSRFGDINLAVDMINTDSRSLNMYMEVKDAYGVVHVRSVSVPENSSNTYYALLSGKQLSVDSGLREDPKTWPGNDKKMYWMWGSKHIALDKVSSIRFFADPYIHEGQPKKIRIQNIRLRKNPQINPAFLMGVADKFGQSEKFDFPSKITSDQQLSRLAKEEVKYLESAGNMSNRSRYGGWLEGPKLKATGFFRTEKYQGKWWLVDPEGYLFFSSGLANIRMANTTTMTGIDFHDESVRYVDKTGVTPEDSLGIRPVSKKALQTRYVSSEMRNNMFSWLPSYDDPLANHYSYRRSVHRGPVKHGETFSFYQANLERRYGEQYPGLLSGYMA